MKKPVAFGLWGALPTQMLNANALAVYYSIDSIRPFI
jgi:hypothetical protein